MDMEVEDLGGSVSPAAGKKKAEKSLSHRSSSE